jgi:hypothetical protein
MAASPIYQFLSRAMAPSAGRLARHGCVRIPRSVRVLNLLQEFDAALFRVALRLGYEQGVDSWVGS